MPRTVQDALSEEETQAVLLFDGVCNLCDAFVQFVIDRDPEGRIKLGTLQSEEGQRCLGRCEGASESSLDTVVLVTAQGCYTRSRAALHVLYLLGGGWRLFYVLMLVPRPVRDRAYDWIAANRYRWFGKRASCRVPTPELQERFL